MFFFENLAIECMKQFTDVYNYNDLTYLIRIKLTNWFERLKTEIERYNVHQKEILKKSNAEMIIINQSTLFFMKIKAWYFESHKQPNNLICFEFKNHTIIPTD